MQRNSIVGNVAKIMVKNADEKWEAVQSIKVVKRVQKYLSTSPIITGTKIRVSRLQDLFQCRDLYQGTLPSKWGCLQMSNLSSIHIQKMACPMYPWILHTGTYHCVRRINSRFHSRLRLVGRRKRFRRSQRKPSRERGQKQTQRNQQLKEIFPTRAGLRFCLCWKYCKGYQGDWRNEIKGLTKPQRDRRSQSILRNTEYLTGT